jgi:hypothetical protein
MLAALILFLGMGCDRTSKLPEAAETESGARAAPSENTGGADGAEESSFTVTLLPEAPRAGDKLLTVVRGAARPFGFTWEKNGEPIAGQARARLSGIDLVRGDTIRVVVTAGEKETTAETVIRNSPPKIVSVVPQMTQLYRGADFAVEPRAVDADGDPVEYRYAWRVNNLELVQETGPVLPGEAFFRGDIVKLKVTPQDEVEEGEPFSKGLEYEVGNAPPRIVSSPPTSITSLDYRYQARATDADEDEITYQLAKGPEGMTIHPVSGLVLWSMPADASGTFEVRIEALDAVGEWAWQEFSLEIERGGKNSNE